MRLQPENDRGQRCSSPVKAAQLLTAVVAALARLAAVQVHPAPRRRLVRWLQHLPRTETAEADKAMAAFF